MRTIGSAAFVLAAGVLLATGCSSTVATSPSDSASPTASASSTKASWVRGTKVTLTNSSGSAVEYGATTESGGKAPEVTYSVLSNGISASETENRCELCLGTNIFMRVKYSDGKAAEFWAENPMLGSPRMHWRTGPSTADWANTDETAEPRTYDWVPDENQSKTVTVADHSVTINRGSDDDNNKNWTITLS